MIDNDKYDISSKEDLININRKIVQLGKNI